METLQHQLREVTARVNRLSQQVHNLTLKTAMEPGINLRLETKLLVRSLMLHQAQRTKRRLTRKLRQASLRDSPIH